VTGNNLVSIDYSRNRPNIADIMGLRL